MSRWTALVEGESVRWVCRYCHRWETSKQGLAHCPSHCVAREQKDKSEATVKRKKKFEQQKLF